MGTGSTTTEGQLKEVLLNQNIEEKGAKVTHEFYRSLLKKAEDYRDKLDQSLCRPFENFYKECFAEHIAGITKHKNTSGQIMVCPEPVVTSITGAAVNQFLARSCVDRRCRGYRS